MKIPLAVIAIFSLMPASLSKGPTTPTETTPATTPYTTPTTPPTTTPPSEEKWIDVFEEFMDLVHYMKWKLEFHDRVDDELTIKILHYYYRGIEAVGGGIRRSSL
ncbi:MAG: hypothetical protein N3E36_03455 [Sulfolobales archaeon]|nr:hypothetical protein [Sulfolobales archaeon]MCX8199069.1 hypothetical protein [Sulfolobales archaeon]MDW8170048.1 hypothetical protein [Desulfurococcaceae archaeon]